MLNSPIVDQISSFKATPSKNLYMESHFENESDGEIDVIREIHGHWKFMGKFILEVLFVEVKK